MPAWSFFIFFIIDIDIDINDEKYEREEKIAARFFFHPLFHCMVLTITGFTALLSTKHTRTPDYRTALD